MQQAVRDGLIQINPTRFSGWQSEYQRAEDELDDPRTLALSDWDALTALSDALVQGSYDQYAGWGSVVVFAACTAARISEVSGIRVKDIDPVNWVWTPDAIPRHGCSPGPTGDASAPRCRGTPPTGTRSSPRSVWSICAATTYATPV
ncbi:hypothetical protein ABZ554_42860 [Streptomyces sp. NPDC020125]|uniref:hypothetical protein n=1 Tax=Streptomyces sp. NPDC020125 TaxID=3154593 RepID=UPI0033E9B230